ncbi:uncharacterized protein G2W53_007459 [Senna tora]|uniref:Uncharacterized protein n=1 Tax=Senna tora TaxID=362788 RepID=A0A834X719_9FABA|nr:uncharacterized protein G2W53_007459 [Senna tora]
MGVVAGFGKGMEDWKVFVGEKG